MASNLKPQDQAILGDFAKGRITINQVSKAALIEIHRKAFGRVGDSARTSQDEYVTKLSASFDETELQAFAIEIVGVPAPDRHDHPVITNSQTGEQTVLDEVDFDQPKHKPSNDKAKALAELLGEALSGFDETKMQKVVKAETDKAVESVRVLAEQMRHDGREAARIAGEARQDAETMRQAFAEAAAKAKESAEAAVVEAIAKSIPHRVEVKRSEGTVVDVGVQHKTFPELLALIEPGINIWLAGPAGSGKTTAGEKVAEALGLDFHHIGKVLSEFQLLGYKDAHGNYHSTPFYEAYTKGGLFLLDEVDGSAPDAVLPLNMAIENGHMAFPNGLAKKHPNFICIAAGNTFGQGATADYVGRNKLDAAFLDRFVFLEWNYDESFELLLCGNAKWHTKVVAWRQRARDKGIKVIISPRASIVGAKLLSKGIDESKVIDMVVKKGMTADQWRAIA